MKYIFFKTNAHTHILLYLSNLDIGALINDLEQHVENNQ